MLILGLGLLFFLSLGPVAPAALWALALLLAITNAALFIESAAGRLPALSQVGSLFSWVVMASWWLSAAGSVGVLQSLLVVVGLTLVTLAGHSWSVRARGEASSEALAVRARRCTSASSGTCSCCCSPPTARGRCRRGRSSRRSAAMTLGTSAAALLSQGRDPARRRHDRGRGRDHRMEQRRRVTSVGNDRGAGSRRRQRLRAPVASARVPFRGCERSVAWAAALASSSARCPSSPRSRAARCLRSRCSSPPTSSISRCCSALTTEHRWPLCRGRGGRARVAGVAPVAGQPRSRRRRGRSCWRSSVALYAVFVAYPFVVGRRAAGQPRSLSRGDRWRARWRSSAPARRSSPAVSTG